MFTRSARVVARSSVRPASALSWRVKGSAASSTGSSRRTLGVASVASARRGGSVPSRAVSAGRVARSVSRSAGIDAASAWSWVASALAVAPRLVTTPFSASSSSASAPLSLAVPRCARRMSSSGSWPSERVRGHGQVAQRGRGVGRGAVQGLRGAAAQAGGQLAQQRLEVGARVALEGGQHVAEQHRRGGLAAAGSRRRRPARGRRACPAGCPRRSCPPGRCASAPSAARPRAAAARRA